MTLSPWPDLDSPRRIALLALVVTLIVAAYVGWIDRDITTTVGDTDDALRLVMVRDLLGGRGWYDQLVPRLQPPSGLWMHWSRLIDGGLAAMIWLFSRVMSPSSAEWSARFFWPLLWIYPAVLASLIIAARLGARSALPTAAIMFVIDKQAFAQFLPGRIDHHNVQIAMTLIALAAALARKRRATFGAVAGAATAMGLAIGTEALAFHALIGVGFALRLMLDRSEARPAGAYGIGLSISALALHAAATPPQRWLLPQCDAMGVNLVVGLVLAGLGLAAAAFVAPRTPAPVRLGVVPTAGLMAAAACLALDPACLGGPFAVVDQRVGPFWFDHIQELMSVPRQFAIDPATAIHFVVMATMASAAGVALLAHQWRAPPAAALLTVGLLALSIAIGWQAVRMQTYVFWFGLPVLAGGLSWLGKAWLRDRMLTTALAACLASPVFLTAVAHAAVAQTRPVKIPMSTATDRCFQGRSYAALSAQPPGLVLAPVDLGSYILADTPHSVVSASYHRMTASVLAAHQAFDADPAVAEQRVRGLRVDYVVDCRGYDMQVAAGSFGDRLRRGDVPPWLKRLSNPAAVLQIYRVRPLRVSAEDPSVGDPAGAGR